MISRCPSSRQQGRVPDHAARRGQAPPPGHPVWAPHALGATRMEFHLPGPSSRAAPSVGLKLAQGRQTPRGPPRATVAGGAARCEKEEDRKGTARHKNVLPAERYTETRTGSALAVGPRPARVRVPPSSAQACGAATRHVHNALALPADPGRGGFRKEICFCRSICCELAALDLQEAELRRAGLSPGLGASRSPFLAHTPELQRDGETAGLTSWCPKKMSWIWEGARKARRGGRNQCGQLCF